MTQIRSINYNGQEHTIKFIYEKSHARLIIGENEYRNPSIINVKGTPTPYYSFDITLQGQKLQVVVYREKEIFLVDNGKVVGTDEQIKLEPLTLKQRVLMRFVPLLPIISGCLESYIYYSKHLNDSSNTVNLCLGLHFAWLIAAYIFYIEKIKYFERHPAISNKEKYKKIYLHTAIYVLIYVVICALRAFNL